MAFCELLACRVRLAPLQQLAALTEQYLGECLIRSGRDRLCARRKQETCEQHASEMPERPPSRDLALSRRAGPSSYHSIPTPVHRAVLTPPSATKVSASTRDSLSFVGRS